VTRSSRIGLHPNNCWDRDGMGFTYKLEALRRYRQFEEDRLQRQLSDALRSLETVKRSLAGLDERRLRCQEEFKVKLENGAAAAQTAMYPGYLKQLTAEIDECSLQVRDAEATCEQIRGSLVEAMKKRRMLDRLKEKEQKAFMADLGSREERFIGEIAINRFAHKQTPRE
jgi:flagellar protein FliJ